MTVGTDIDTGIVVAFVVVGYGLGEFLDESNSGNELDELFPLLVPVVVVLSLLLFLSTLIMGLVLRLGVWC